MPCYSPWVQKGEGWSRPISCGQCRGCRLEKSRQDAVRCMHEAKMHEKNSFLTLTYRVLPQAQWCHRCESQLVEGSLHHCEYQLFMKRLVKAYGAARFYMSGEYGETTGRPHYHACIFGVRPDDLEYLGKSPGGHRLYRSARLEALWPLGFVSVGDVTFESAAYVARYVMKKLTGPREVEYGGKVPEYSRRSNGGRSGKRGIGFGWFDEFGKSDVLHSGRVVVNGVEASAPRYYRRLLRDRFPMTYRKVQIRDEAKAREGMKDSSNSRLEAKEKVALARLSFSKRNL